MEALKDMAEKGEWGYVPWKRVEVMETASRTGDVP